MGMYKFTHVEKKLSAVFPIDIPSYNGVKCMCSIQAREE